jgi:hypothetical protein
MVPEQSARFRGELPMSANLDGIGIVGGQQLVLAAKRFKISTALSPAHLRYKSMPRAALSSVRGSLLLLLDVLANDTHNIRIMNGRQQLRITHQAKLQPTTKQV